MLGCGNPGTGKESVTRAGDQRGAKACGLGPDGVPDVGGDHHAVARSDFEF